MPHDTVSYATSYFCASAWGCSFVRQVSTPMSAICCRFFCFNFVDWKVWQKTNNYNEKVFGIEAKNAKISKINC
jgi:hypothetical protein